jgi:predicted transcriptional regulator
MVEKKKMSVEYVAGGAFVLLLISVSLWAYDEAVNPKNRIVHSEDGPRFPTLRGATLSGKVLVLPAMRSEVDAWIQLAQDLADRFDGFTYYELLTIERVPAVARAVINTGIRSGLIDPTERDATVTLYLDQASFRQALGIQSKDEVAALLINSEGEILWRAEGALSGEGEQALIKAVSTFSINH